MFYFRILVIQLYTRSILQHGWIHLYSLSAWGEYDVTAEVTLPASAVIEVGRMPLFMAAVYIVIFYNLQLTERVFFP